MEPTNADDTAERADSDAAPDADRQGATRLPLEQVEDPLLQAGIELLRAMPAAKDHACRHCGRPAGLFEECQRCFLDRLESQFDELMAGESAEAAAAEAPAVEAVAAEPEAEPEPAVEPEPEPVSEEKPAPDSEPAVAAVELPPAVPYIEPPAAGGRVVDGRRVLALVAAGAVLIAAALLIFSGSSNDVTPASSETPPELTGLGAAPDPAMQILGTWSGEIDIQYESGLNDKMHQTVTVKRLNEGGPAGFSSSRQNGGTCNGPLTFLGFDAGSYRFRYEEMNTKECIAAGTIALTPTEDGSLAYKEVTKSSVNSGTLTAQ